jgi:hypothetical protein
MLTERVPIIGPFTPSYHFGNELEAGNIPFGEVFDIDYLSDKIGMPILEWHEVKNLSAQAPEIEDIGCWSVWQAVQDREPTPRITNALPLQGLGEQNCMSQNKLCETDLPSQDISFTAGPKSLSKSPGNPHEIYAHFWNVASLLYSPSREESLIPPQPSKVHGAVLPPDEHLACFDYLYSVCAHTVSNVAPSLPPLPLRFSHLNGDSHSSSNTT